MKEEIIKRSADRPKPVDKDFLRLQEDVRLKLIENKIRIDELKARYKKEV